MSAHDESHHHHGHHHNHSHHHTPGNYNRAFIVGLILNVSFVLIEFSFGFFANSITLIADAGHNLSDVLGLLLAWIASLLAQRQSSSKYTYGWRKSSIIAAFLNAVFLMLVTGSIIWESMQRLMHPHEVQSLIMIYVAIVGVLINTGTALMFLSGRKDDLNIRAAFQHMAADALVSIGAVFAGIGILFTNWLWLDPVFSLFISALIILGTWGLLKESFHLSIDGVPPNIDERLVHTYLSEHAGIEGIHDLHIWSLSTMEVALTAHLIMPGGHPGDDVLLAIGRELKEHFNIHHSTLQIEIGDSDRLCPLVNICQN
jgi:cobalt-zinc-cadmium efflux system protein